MEFRNLDEHIRELMKEELEKDIETNSLYFSSRLNKIGLKDYPVILRKAIVEGNPDSFAEELHYRNCLKPYEQRQKPKGGFTTVKIPINAANTLAEGEFNRFYIRAVCRKAIECGISYVIAYRAKKVKNPRLESDILIGKSIDASNLLNDLRTHPGVDTALGLPAGPNSGLSVMLPD